jgi:hypothetical protein
MLKKKASLVLLSTFALALPFAARAQSESELVNQYTNLAGSPANAQSLVDGLRDGKQVTLTNGGSTTTFTPPTSKMGNGNVNIALALTDASLKQQGITNPTTDQLKTALNNVLAQRASGKGWGEIANAMGFKLGDVMRSERADKVARDRRDRDDHGDRDDRKDRADRDDRRDRAERAERPERAERVERPERPERPEKPERPDRSERGGRG